MFASEFEAYKAPPYCWGAEHCVKVDFSMYNFAFAVNEQTLCLFEEIYDYNYYYHHNLNIICTFSESQNLPKYFHSEEKEIIITKFQLFILFINQKFFICS